MHAVTCSLMQDVTCTQTQVVTCTQTEVLSNARRRRMSRARCHVHVVTCTQTQEMRLGWQGHAGGRRVPERQKEREIEGERKRGGEDDRDDCGPRACSRLNAQ